MVLQKGHFGFKVQEKMLIKDVYVSRLCRTSLFISCQLSDPAEHLTHGHLVHSHWFVFVTPLCSVHVTSVYCLSVLPLWFFLRFDVVPHLLSGSAGRGCRVYSNKTFIWFEVLEVLIFLSLICLFGQDSLLLSFGNVLNKMTRNPMLKNEI